MAVMAGMRCAYLFRSLTFSVFSVLKQLSDALLEFLDFFNKLLVLHLC